MGNDADPAAEGAVQAEDTEFTPLAEARTVLERVRTLNGVTWEWIDERHRTDERRRYMGLIAQEVQQAFPEAVASHEEGLMVDYSGLVGALVEAVKELATRIEALEAAAHPAPGRPS